MSDRNPIDATHRADPIDTVLGALQSAGKQPKRAGTGWMAQCPAHDDKNPSLSIGVGSDGRALLHCHSGCSHKSIIESLGLRESDLFPPDPTSHQPPNRHHHRLPPSESSHTPRESLPSGYATAQEAIAEYEKSLGPPTKMWPYHDSAGIPVGITLRWDREGQKKAIRPVSLHPDGLWRCCAMPAPRPMLRLPAILKADTSKPVYIVEGEKAADAAKAAGLLATTAAGGSNAGHLTDWTPLKGRKVIMLPDRDAAGEKYATTIAQIAQTAQSASVRTIELWATYPDIPEGGDIADIDIDPRTLGTAITELVDAIPIPPPTIEVGDMVGVLASEITPTKLEWLWPGKFPMGKYSLIAGDPGLGKSLVTIDMAARISNGVGWACGAENESGPGGVILLSAEDDASDTVVPRLIAAQADLTRIRIITAVRAEGDRGKHYDRQFDLSRDIEGLERTIAKMDNPRLIVIDPISAYLGQIDSHNNAEVRSVLAPLAALASRTKTAIVGVTHLNKGQGAAIYRAMGSLAFTAAARAAWAVSKDKDDESRRLVLPIKANLAKDTGGMAYRVVSGHNNEPRLEWEPGQVFITSNDALSGRDSDPEPERPKAWTTERFVAEVIGSETLGKESIMGRASVIAGMSQRMAERNLRAAIELGIVREIVDGGNLPRRYSASSGLPI